jgi:hypothetical protein
MAQSSRLSGLTSLSGPGPIGPGCGSRLQTAPATVLLVVSRLTDERNSATHKRLRRSPCPAC